jgi:hypothetical protein
MNLDIINERVDKALADNRRAENIVIGMAVAIFILGVALVIVAYWRLNPYVGGGAIIFQGLLYWPIKEILKLRRDNVILQSLPAIVTALPFDRAADEIEKMLAFLRR